MTKNQQVLAKMGGGSLALLLSLSLGQQASAATLVENLPPTTSTHFEPSVKVDQWVGSSFTTGNASYGYTLNSVTLWFREFTAGTNLLVSLYSDNAGAIDSQITGFTNPGSITPSLANNTFTLTTPETLDANTTYWLVAGISLGGSGEYRWGGTTSADQNSSFGWSIGDSSVVSTNGGGSWSNISDPPFKAFQFSVDGTVKTSPPIPEPGSVVALLGLGGLGLASGLKKLFTRA
jgi:hypothetical protein